MFTFHSVVFVFGARRSLRYVAMVVLQGGYCSVSRRLYDAVASAPLVRIFCGRPISLGLDELKRDLKRRYRCTLLLLLLLRIFF